MIYFTETSIYLILSEVVYRIWILGDFPVNSLFEQEVSSMELVILKFQGTTPPGNLCPVFNSGRAVHRTFSPGEQ
jgi:hypothetical protein